jgi:hypothetical protein
MSFFSAGTFVAWGSIAYKYGWVSITIQWMMVLAELSLHFFLPTVEANRRTYCSRVCQESPGRERAEVLHLYLPVSIPVQQGICLYPVAKLVSISLGFPLFLVPLCWD